MRCRWWLMNETYYFSCNKFTVRVVTNSRGVIVDAAPIVRRFIGQPRNNLKRWADKFGGVRIVRIGQTGASE